MRAKNKNEFIVFIRWIARIAGFVVLACFVISGVIHGLTFSDGHTSSFREILSFVFIVSMLAGIVMAWFWEGIGGVIILAGFLFLWIVEVIFTRSFRGNGAFVIFPILSLLYIFCWKNSVENE
jgi:hypothetical protein